MNVGTFSKRNTWCYLRFPFQQLGRKPFISRFFLSWVKSKSNLMKNLLPILLALFFVTDGYSRIRLKRIDVAKGEIEIKNVAGFAYDYNNFQLTVNNDVYNLSNTNITSGNLNAGIDEVIIITGFTLPTMASLGIWYPNTFPASGNPNLVDFMQYGSAGNPYEASADSAGLWTIGDFVAGNPPYTHTGGPFDEGVGFWQGSGIGLYEITGINAVRFYPNPAQSPAQY